MERGEILDRTYDLYHGHCNGCTKWKAVGTKKYLKKVQDFCEKQCPVGRELLELGDRLTYGRPTKVGRSLIKDVYLEERESGLVDEEIAAKHGLSVKVLQYRKAFWGLITPPKEDQCTKENYIQEKAKGLPDEYIARKLGVHTSTLAGRKSRWGMKSDSRTVQVIAIGGNGEQITPENYIMHKKNGLTDDQIRDLWMIGRTTLQSKKKNWRKAGHNIDQYTKANIPRTVKYKGGAGDEASTRGADRAAEKNYL
jgi:hypothetical protein